MPTKKYTYYDYTISLCSTCLKRISAKIIFEDEKVFMLKTCSTHGEERVLIATDIEYYKRCRNFLKPGESPLKFNTETLYGCPYDCGLCPDHEQHSCLTVLEITDRCNLTCPTCYAESSPSHGRHKTLEEIETMLDIIVANEGYADVVQISGGEPTIHPQIFEIIALAKSKQIRHIMLNTNGIRIAKDKEFVRKLAEYKIGFEVYLQFDSFKKDALERLRGEDLREVRQKAIEHLDEFNISTSLVVTVQKGVNEDEIGAIIDYALTKKCLRGVTFQPTQIAGRLDNFNPATDRYTMTEIRSAILNQTNVFTEKDLIPVPCNPDALVMGYALKLDNQAFPLTSMLNPEEILANTGNTIVFERDEKLKGHLLKVFSTATSVDAITPELSKMLCCLPSIAAPNLTYENVFRIIIMNFIDAYNFDVRAIKRSCVHIINDTSGKIIPFETMNLFYRGDKVKRLEKLRKLT
ncbi:MAG TPA: radical SAM protein [Leptospiraceae bacterium]|nr:radical SAM protein [Leptospiraceae bacterium]